MRAYLRLQNGKIQDYHVRFLEEQIDGVTAVFIDGFSNQLLDSELGAVIEWKVEGLAFLWAEGENPYQMMEQCAKIGLQLLNTGCRTRKERCYPEMFRLMHSSKLYSFQTDPKRFPNGLKACIDKMKSYGLTVGM